MTYDKRQAWGRHSQEQLSKRIAEIAPGRINRWALLREYVSAPGVNYMIALSTWEADPTDKNEGKLMKAHDGVIDSWWCAAAAFTAEMTEA